MFASFLGLLAVARSLMSNSWPSSVHPASTSSVTSGIFSDGTLIRRTVEIADLVAWDRAAGRAACPRPRDGAGRGSGTGVGQLRAPDGNAPVWMG
jgi:hypothetical protein